MESELRGERRGGWEGALRKRGGDKINKKKRVGCFGASSALADVGLIFFFFPDGPTILCCFDERFIRLLASLAPPLFHPREIDHRLCTLAGGIKPPSLPRPLSNFSCRSPTEPSLPTNKMSSTHHGHPPSTLLTHLLCTITDRIVPLTTPAVARGCKVFGAAVLSKRTLLPIVCSTNDELVSPLLHGEVATLLAFHRHNAALPIDQRIDPRDCIFLSTHEPCSLCLSAITWSGFDNFYFMFTYKDTQDLFAIPHDINIIKQVFQTKDTVELYNRQNTYWKAYAFQDLIDQSRSEEQHALSHRLQHVKQQYNDLSETYQRSKRANQGAIPLA